MTKTEFRDYINQAKQAAKCFADQIEEEEQIAQKMRRFDPVLSDLLLANVNAAKAVCEYIYSKSEEEIPDFLTKF